MIRNDSVDACHTCAQVKIKGSNKISFPEFEESLSMVAEKKVIRACKIEAGRNPRL